MAVTNSSVQDITADTLLSTSKPKIKDNFDDLLANDVDVELRVTGLEAVVNTSTPKIKFTAEGGLAVKLTNKTGSNSVKGSVVSISSSVDNAFTLQTNEFDSVGVVYDDGIADGQECWVVEGGRAQVLLKDGTASTRGNWVICADTDGRADATQPTPSPNNTTGEHTQHFKEIGHCMETKSSGTSVLAYCTLHFN